jgi:hypothetical protein
MNWPILYVEPRSEGATSSSRFSTDYARAEEAASNFLDQDKVVSLQELHEKLDRSCLPGGVYEVREPTIIRFFTVKHDRRGAPKMGFSLEVMENMEFDIW